LATECNVSAVSIGDRFAELEKAGVISGSTLQVDHCTLGANVTCGVIVKVDKKDIEPLVAFIRKIPFEVPLIIQGARNDVYFLTSLKDINDLAHLKEIIRKNNAVQSLRTEIWTGIRNIPENLKIINTTQSQPEHVFTPPVPQGVDVDLDALDFKIINKLSQNSMQPFSDIAKDVGTSIKTVSRKYRRLFENGIIKPTIQVDLPKLGYHGIANFMLALSSESDIESVLNEVMAIEDLFLIIKTSGEYDLAAYVLLKDINQLLATQDHMTKIPGISQTETSVFPVWAPWPTINEAISTF
jgi:Lrp/AsnC family transcriptional regulator for asnA, asnC and gidA